MCGKPEPPLVPCNSLDWTTVCCIGFASPYRAALQSTFVSMQEMTLMLAPDLPLTVNILLVSSSSFLLGRILSCSSITICSVTTSLSCWASSSPSRRPSTDGFRSRMARWTRLILILPVKSIVLPLRVYSGRRSRV